MEVESKTFRSTFGRLYENVKHRVIEVYILNKYRVI